MSEVCCEDIITHREQIKTLYNKVDEYKVDCKEKYDDIKKETSKNNDEVNIKMDKINTKIDGFQKGANRYLITGIVFLLSTIVQSVLHYT